ncbi:MAG: hypothetical protein OQK35_04790 [Alphaproteobacteria bacterium]|nr:hypothetical protein [Rhodospirillales bacterium]MCW9045628.1 hypothetical protein [Alphaproteobacteria bacterium]
MYEFPTNGRTAFQVGVYNRDVRALVKENKSHEGIRDEWADVHLQDVLAHDEQEAKDIILRRYPEAQGFVVESVVLDNH